MLSFAAEYRSAIDSMTAARDLGLRKYELDQAEWKIVGELRDVLKVSVYSCLVSVFFLFAQRYTRTRRSFSRVEHPILRL